MQLPDRNGGNARTARLEYNPPSIAIVQGIRNLDILRLLSIHDSMGEKRLGDVIDDHCIKCRRVTNHSIVSLVEGEAAKVRCRTCYHDHDYRHEQAPPTKKELKKMEADALAAAEAAAGPKAPSDGVGIAEPAPETSA